MDNETKETQPAEPETKEKKNAELFFEKYADFL